MQVHLGIDDKNVCDNVGRLLDGSSGCPTLPSHGR